MSRAIKLSKEFEEFDFLTLYKVNRGEKYIYRCLACHYIQSGKNYDETSQIIKYSRNSIMLWVKQFCEGGIKSLLGIKAGRGRKAKLSSDLKQEFSEAIVSLQESRGGGRVIGKDIVKFVEKQYGVKYTLSGMYDVLSRMGMSWVSARSIHPKTNIEKQEAFKKTLM
jgi:transposase